jgi:hypothetical protein
MGLVLTLLACGGSQKPAETAPPAPPAASAGSDTPATTAQAVPPAPVLPNCEAKHALPDLPLSAVDANAWAEQLGRYVPIANSGRPAPLDEARADVDTYLARLGACMERVFVGSFLESLKTLPKDHALADMTLTATVELAIDGETGKLAESGVVSSSGVAEFDAAVVATFAGVLPVGELKPGLLSSDGRFYVTWEVRRDPATARDLTLARAWKLRF